MDTITLNAGDKIAIQINGQTFEIEHVIEGDDHAVELAPTGCDLEGDGPGFYWVRAHAAASV